MRALSLLSAGAVVLTPALVALTALQPVEAAPPEPYGSFGLTVTAAAVRTGGDLGAGGGLATLEAGVGFSAARLDDAPSSYALGAPVEPGPLIRSLFGTANNAAGQDVLTVTEAEAAYPGKGTASSSYADPAVVGPLVVTPGSASSTAGPYAATARSTGAAVTAPGALDGSRLAASTSVSGSDPAGAATASGESAFGSLVVAGVLELDDVRARATVTAHGAVTRATAALTIGRAAVAGVPVSIDSDGVHAAGQDGDLGALQAAQDTVDQALSAAGVSVRLLAVTRRVTGRSGYADTGGVVVHLVTPDLPAGVPGNKVTVTLGKVTVSGTTAAAEPPVEVPPAVDPGTPAVPPTTTVTVVQDPGALGGPAPRPASSAAAPQVAGTGGFLLAGHRLSTGAAFAGFAAWQLVSLALTTLYALVDRRRRVALASLAEEVV